MKYDDPQSSSLRCNAVEKNWGSTKPPSIVPVLRSNTTKDERVRLSAVQLWQAGRTCKYMLKKIVHLKS